MEPGNRANGYNANSYNATNLQLKEKCYNISLWV